MRMMKFAECSENARLWPHDGGAQLVLKWPDRGLMRELIMLIHSLSGPSLSGVINSALMAR